jgi:geranylgeranyl reductase family protein
VKRVAVLGGGPAGAVAAAKLAAAGLETILLDEKLAWEKPCGGGITYKAYNRYPFLNENTTPKKVVSTTVLSESRSVSVSMELRRPILIYSRLELNRMLLERAENAGARIEKERVVGLERTSSGWKVKTKRSSLEADFCVVATGARNSLKNVGTEYTASDAMCAIGYYVPTTQAQIDIQFFPKFEGYIWVFPRSDHLSVGICAKGEPPSRLRVRLERWMAERGIPVKDAVFFAHMIPALERPSFARNRVCGEGWMAVGDAAGLVDPVTGEGIYYAVRSGDLAAEAVLNEHHAPLEKHKAYRSLLHNDFMEDLIFGAGLARRFFLQRFLFSSVPGHMIRLMRRSPRMAVVVQDLFAGTQNYLELKKRLLDTLNGTMWEIFMGMMLSRRVVKEGKV